MSLNCGSYSIGFTQIEIPIEHPTLHFSKKMFEKLQETLFETIPFHSILVGVCECGSTSPVQIHIDTRWAGPLFLRDR